MVASDLHGISIDDGWNYLCQDRKELTELCKQQIQIALQQGGGSICTANQGPSKLSTCGRSFHRQGELDRHE